MENAISREMTESTGNVYRDIGVKDPDSMLRKAELVSGIQDAIEARGWTQRQAAEALGMSQPRLSRMLRGQFHGISETRLLRCLTILGNDVRIVVIPPRAANAGPGDIQLVFA